MKILNRAIIYLVGVLLCCCYIPIEPGNCQPMPNNNFVKVIDVATSIYTRSDEWRRSLENAKMIFKVPECPLTARDFPSTFNFKRDFINVCGNVEALHPWKDLHEKAGEMLARTIREQYKLSKLNSKFIHIDTSNEGYFTAMKKAVDSGECDVAISATNWNQERAQQVHFQCAYASSHFGYLRSELDPQYATQNVTDLNLEGITVAVSIGTITDTWASNNLKRATIIRVATYPEAFQMVLEKKIHSIIADSMDLFVWMSQNKNNCSTCKARAFGEGIPMGSFLSNSLLDTSLAFHNQILSLPLMIFLTSLLFLSFY